MIRRPLEESPSPYAVAVTRFVKHPWNDGPFGPVDG